VVTLTRRTLVVLFAAEAAAFAFLIFALADRKAHLANPNGINQWGFRGEARGERIANEIRIGVIGGSAAYEAATPHENTMAQAILTQLQEVGRPVRQEYSVVNLAEPRAGADAYPDMLRAYEFLGLDVVCIFDGYDALGGLPPHAREHSRVFRAVGYLPILPARLLNQPAWMSDPDGGLIDLLREGADDVSCAGASRTYCSAMADTVRLALQRGHPIVVASPPSPSPRRAAQQRSLGEALTGEFGKDPRFVHLNLESAINLNNRSDSPDGLHRTVVGNHEVGQRIAVAVLRLLDRLGITVSGRAGGSR
jgi:hypothetical protein